MDTNPSSKPLDKLIEATQANLPGKAFADATRHMIENYPAPGSMETSARLAGMQLCPQCKAMNSREARFCRNCGSPMPKPQSCPRCQQPVQPSDKFCSACGSPLASTPSALSS